MLHTINKSPFEKSSLQTCLRYADDGSSILLIEDGVYAASKGTEFEKLISSKNNIKFQLTIIYLKIFLRNFSLFIKSLKPCKITKQFVQRYRKINQARHKDHH